jgi:hypothetical protein
VRGLRDEVDYFLTCIGARKALITNATYVRSSGYLARMLCLLVMNLKLFSNEDKSRTDCGSPHLISVNVDSQQTLNRLHGNYYTIGHSGELLVATRDSSELIGKVIHKRSPITCLAPGNEICETCYGELHKTNPFHPALSGVLVLTEQIIQMLLSTKHLLQVNTEQIALPKSMLQLFYIDKESLIAREPMEIVIDNAVEDEDCSDEDYRFCITSFHVITGKERKVTTYSLDDRELFLGPVLDQIDLTALRAQNDVTVKIGKEQEVCRINVENTELSTPLKRLIALIDNEKTLNEYSTSLLLAEMYGLLNKSTIAIGSTTVEIILRELMRDPDDLLSRPKDFTNYRMLKLKNALVHSSSTAITLAFERLKYVLETNLFDKTGDSVIDGLYVHRPVKKSPLSRAVG